MRPFCHTAVDPPGERQRNSDLNASQWRKNAKLARQTTTIMLARSRVSFFESRFMAVKEVRDCPAAVRSGRRKVAAASRPRFWKRQDSSELSPGSGEQRRRG